MSKSILTLCCLAVLMAGCGPSNRLPTKEEAEQRFLQDVGELCRHYQTAKKKPPAKVTDLASVKSMATNAYEELRAGRIILRYGATLTDTGDEPGQGESDEILAYEAKVPESGGKVLMLNRAVKTMTADEFKAAKKAGKD